MNSCFFILVRIYSVAVESVPLSNKDSGKQENPYNLHSDKKFCETHLYPQEKDSAPSSISHHFV